MKRQQGKMIFIIGLCLVLIILLAGCSGGTPNSSVQKETAVTEETEINKEAAVTEETVSTSEENYPGKEAEVAIGAITVADIMKTVSDSPYIDKTHLDSGLACETCHGELPDSNLIPNIPKMDTCLTCHGGEYSNLPVVNHKNWGDLNLHRNHNYELACSECHQVHNEYSSEYIEYCSSCH